MLARERRVNATRHERRNDLIIQRHVALESFTIDPALGSAGAARVGDGAQVRARIVDHGRTGDPELSGEIQNLVVVTTQVERIHTVACTSGERREDQAQ